jgi:hypothetical protein
MFPNRFLHRAAFSLLEVTLVVVIVFLLSLALIPAFRGKRAEVRYPVLPPATPVRETKPATPVPLPNVEPAAPPAPATPQLR